MSIPYGISDFKRIRNEGYYHVDKTAYISRLEAAGSFIFFVRPRRFGKSLLVDMLRNYYDVNEKSAFEKLFGDLAVGKAPTANRNRYMALQLDFSKVGGMSGDGLAGKFANYLDAALDDFISRYRPRFPAGTFDGVAPEKKYKEKGKRKDET